MLELRSDGAGQMPIKITHKFGRIKFETNK